MSFYQILRSNDPKVLEFLEYLGIDIHLSTNVVITIPSGGVVTVEDTRKAEKKEEK